jgi:hypothetical protein
MHGVLSFQMGRRGSLRGHDRLSVPDRKQLSVRRRKRLLVHCHEQLVLSHAQSVHYHEQLRLEEGKEAQACTCSDRDREYGAHLQKPSTKRQFDTVD